ncbi:MAG: HipA N-terminal domain-containing protein [Halomonas sp.]|nr:HipA N-terminal domain-containing protein [Halomonas sp.]MBR2514280.1 HipA N-terminal domain-containing protein [Halomonas sp.]
MASEETLALYHGERQVGWLYDSQPLRFEYAAAWLAYPEAVSLSPSLPLTQQAMTC